MVRIDYEYYKAYKEDTNDYTIGENDVWIKESRFCRKKIAEIIEESGSENYDEYLEKEDDWWMFYHLSTLRTSILNWYEFKEESILLEVGGELGALTGLFCDKCSQVTVTEKAAENAEIIASRYRNRNNLSVMACDIDDIPEEKFKDSFDYIVVGKELEYKGYGYWNPEFYCAFLKKLVRWLKPDGKLLIITENRYGIKYLCGTRDPHTGIPFDGINKYPGGSKGYSFSRRELAEVIEGAGIKKFQFFYPLPDSRFPQLIYTDEYKDKRNINERLNFYDPAQDTLLVPERSLYNDIMDNDVLHFLSNSFLIECSNGELSSLLYAVVSTERTRDRAFSTAIYRSGIVKKKYLFPQGKGVLYQSFLAIKELQNRGIPVVSHSWKGESIEMPFRHEEGFTAVLHKTVVKDPERFEKLIEKWYQYILKSSEHVEEEKSENQFGPVLWKGYIDLVPANAFCSGEEIFFYDQEFIREKCPANYIFFRGLKYTYMSMWDMERYYPVKKIREKYGISEKAWNAFEMEEEAFIAGIRSGNQNSIISRWGNASLDEMMSRCNLLGKENKDLLNYSIGKRTKEIQQTGIRLLRKLQEVCSKNHLRYFAFYGTLLGAIRHEGFVPWDDDIDIVMPREDYDKLIEIADEFLADGFFLQTPENDEQCFYGGYAKLRDSNTSAIEILHWDKQCNQGIAMDIMPLDKCYAEESKNNKLQQNILLYQRMIFAKTYPEESQLRDMDENEFSLYKKLAEPFSRKELCQKLKELLTSCKEDTHRVTVLSRYIFWKYQTYNESDFDNKIERKFESIYIDIPGNYDDILKMGYKNYMTWPKPEDRRSHHINVLFSAKVPYLEYYRKFRDVFCGMEQARIVLVGSGRMLDAFMNLYAEKYRPEMIADINAVREYRGYSVAEISNIHQIPENERKVIICNDDFRLYEQELLNNGIWNYYIFAHTKWWLKLNDD